VTLNDFERRKAFILRYFTEFGIALQADSVTVVEGRPIMSAEYRLPVIFGQNCPMQQSHGLFATAKVRVLYTVAYLRFPSTNLANLLHFQPGEFCLF